MQMMRAFSNDYIYIPERILARLFPHTKMEPQKTYREHRFFVGRNTFTSFHVSLQENVTVVPAPLKSLRLLQHMPAIIIAHAAANAACPTTF